MSAPELPPGYPLCWPADWKRTPAPDRGRSGYQITEVDARRRAIKSLRQLGIGRSIITSDKPLRMDGMPLAIGREPTDPGVAVWWIEDGELRAIAVDQYRSVRENVRAIGHALEAIRALERAGASQILQRTKESFRALALPAGRPWFCEPLGLDHWPVSVDELGAAYKARLVHVHPDQNGGRSEDFFALNKAHQAACDALPSGGAR